MATDNFYETKNGRTSFFDGGLLQFIGWTILGILVTVFTLGIYSFWVFIKLEDWKAKNTSFVN
ncbi:hypothetical protein [Listeria booriae]|uniref:hypothetical protein n=1 Tax=Listeria booriae TaxID=1552123 RepID=UPI001628046C|nr:hypothetical protein [Listeria booriae]MBC2181361.1 hypothetical protein [Listeria booriae]MBC2189769.1 hypothetical protein [Listeria booriae]